MKRREALVILATGGSLDGADLSGEDLSGADLTRAELSAADLSKARMYEAHLTGANLTGANLTGAYLYGADLTNANLTDADLTGANLTKVLLSGADLSGATMPDGHPYLAGTEALKIPADTATEVGDAAAMFDLGALAEEAGNMEEAISLYTRAATLGHPKAMYWLGFFEQDAGNMEKAGEWYRRAAEQGDADAMYHLGFLAQDAGNMQEAIKWYMRAVEHDHPEAMFDFGVLAQEAGNKQRAIGWYERAAKHDHPEAMAALSVFAREAGNEEQAEKWNTRVVEHGDRTAIEAAAKAREIDRLCHFTTLDSLRLILESESIMSREKLHREGHEYNRNDHHRLDGHRNHICLSITVPNALLLRKFVKNDSNVGWVVLSLDTSPLWSHGTKFCPVNAATDRGIHIGSGSVAFAKLFEEKPLARSNTRASKHRDDCPTDVQAEVLVESAIQFEHVKEIFVKSDDDARKVLEILNSKSSSFSTLEIRVLKGSFFTLDVVERFVRDNHVPFPAWEVFRGDEPQ